ncbi:MAG: tRNA (adenosine(37)-N6)-dimethylallyltransferase MiaA [Christensenellales bacterium]
MYDAIIIFGATATGKTKISIELAKELKTEIINADSMYIYKDLNIGTAKPDELEMDGIKHHLIDFVESNLNYNVVDYRNDVVIVLKHFKDKNLIPIIVGGTGFYIDSLITNYSYGNASHSEELRKELNEQLEKFGKEFLYNKLKQIDPNTASKLHINDTIRIIRALEINILSGNKLSISNNEELLIKNPLLIGLNMPRDVLYNRINQRVDLMISNGLINEVIDLYNKGLTPLNSQSMKGIGYKELVDYIEGKCTLDFAIDKIKQHTRNYAKRQITWFKKYNNAHWFDSQNDINIVNSIIELFKKENIT